MVVWGGVAAGVLVGLIVFLGRAGGTRQQTPATALPKPARAVPAVAATAPAPTPVPPTPPAPVTAARPPGQMPVGGLARAAAEEYRRRARYPRSSQPLDADVDPLQRDRQVTPIVQRGPHGEDPTLTVYPGQTGYETPDTVFLYAYLSVRGDRVRARDMRGKIVTENLQPIAEVEYRDDGTGGDAVADDELYTAMFAPGPDALPALSRSYLVQVTAVTRRDEERLAATSFLYSNPHAQLTGNYSDAAVGGNLQVGVEVNVLAAGRFHVEATLYGGDGTQPVAWAQTAAELPEGRQWMTLS